MDVVLEISDYFLFDKVFATLVPKNGAVEHLYDHVFNNANSSALGLFGDNTTSIVTSGYSWPTPLKYIAEHLSDFQNKEEIYGLVEGYLPTTEYTDASFLARSNTFRQAISILMITTVFGWVLYLGVAYLSYVFVFDKNIFNHPRYLKNQMALEIYRGVTAIPTMVALTSPFFLFELKGFSKLYMDINPSTGGWWAVAYQIPAFIMFTDCGIYFIHRILHWPSIYKRLHKPHHKWIVCTPFASHAFHPVDGWAQSVPYHLYPLFFPLHKISYLFLFTFVNFWTVMIHDGQYLSNDPVVNGTACHTVHHLYFNYNYGQFTTLWDRLGGSYRRPDDALFAKKDKVDEKTMWKKQVEGMEEIRYELEGKNDDRVYR